MDYAPSSGSRQPFEAPMKLSRGFDRTIIVQIIVASFGKPHELFRFMGEREQSLAKSDRNGGIACAMHDQERSRDTRNALVGAKLIPHQPAHRHDSKPRAGNVRDRRIGRFQDQFPDRLRGRQRHRNPGPERESPDDDSIRAVPRGGEGIGRRGIQQQPSLAGLAARAGITPIGQRDEPGPVRADAAKDGRRARRENLRCRENRSRRHVPALPGHARR